VGTGGETLDPIVITPVTSGASETNLEDPTGNVNFNAQNLQAYTGDYWGVMALTLIRTATRGISSRHWQVLQLYPMVLHFLHRLRMVVIATRASAAANSENLMGTTRTLDTARGEDRGTDRAGAGVAGGMGAGG
jgi:hypothetical protein